MTICAFGNWAIGINMCYQDEKSFSLSSAIDRLSGWTGVGQPAKDKVQL